MRQVLVIALISTLMPCMAMAAEIYRWTDEAGNTHYSGNPPQGVDAQLMNVQTRSSKPASGGDSQAQNESGTGDDDRESDERDEGNEDGNNQRDSEAVAEARRENCEAAREALKMLDENARVQVEEDGERRYLSPEEKEAERERYEEIRDENCQ